MSRLLQDGFLCEPFRLEKRWRQGDPLSPYIFIICAEILPIIVKNIEAIKGIIIDGQEYLIPLNVDDTSFILDRSPEFLYGTFTILDY